MFACIYTPDFLVQAVLRPEEQVYGRTPVVVLDGPVSLLRVAALNPPARTAGLRLGMTKLQAEGCDGVLIRGRSLPCEAAAQAALLECAGKFSPLVESTAPGIVTVDLRGMQRLFTSLQTTAESLMDTASAAGLHTQVAIATGPDAALHVALGLPGITVIPEGKEAAFLSKLPLTVLSPAEEMLEVLQQWGIRSCGQLAALPEQGLAERFGQAGSQLQRYARGDCRRLLVPLTLEQTFSAGCELEEPIERLPPLMVVIGDLLKKVITELIDFALAVEKVELRLELEVHGDHDIHSGPSADVPASTHTLTLSIPTPTQDGGFLAKLLELELATKPPAAPVKKISLQTVPARPRRTQAGLFSALTPEPEKLEITIARIRDEIGEEMRVGSPRLLDSHKPDSFTMVPFSGVPHAVPASEVREPRLCLRRFRPPVPAQVSIREGRPWSLVFHGQTWPVLIASGPWRLSGEWWDRARGWLRQEWHLGLASAEGLSIYCISEDLVTCSWFVNGRFD
jgi:protein ImuB